jgi:hypothetical protein
MVCARCRPAAPEGAVRLDTADAAALARLDRTPFEEIAIARMEGAPALALGRFLASILDRKLRSADFLDSML